MWGRQTDRQIERQTDRQTDRKTDREIHITSTQFDGENQGDRDREKERGEMWGRETDRQIERQTEKYISQAHNLTERTREIETGRKRGVRCGAERQTDR